MRTFITIIFAVIATPILSVGFYARLIIEAFLVGYTNLGGSFVKYLQR